MNNEKQAQDILRGNAVVGQSGGPTAAINATLAGVIRGVTDLRRGRGECPIRHLYGMKNGVDGLLRGELIDLDLLFDPPRRSAPAGAACRRPAHPMRTP